MLDTRLEDLLVQWEDDGKRASAEELCKDCPDLVGPLRERMQALQGLGWLDRLSGQPGPLLPGFEPVPGYSLVRPIGRGGFSEVWLANGPAGSVALKLIPRNKKGEGSEWRSVETLKGVEHPHLLKMLDAWRTEDWLVIALELADRTLMDRWNEVRQQGKDGLPKDEILRYFLQAAEAIDHLHALDIQHRDIKPQNLLLKGDTLKVGDLGLARVLGHSVTGHTGALTMAYAAPEFFEGKTSKHSDQYCLAATYCFLRTGQPPFDGNPAEIMSGHIARKPDLSRLPEDERASVAKALSKRPDDRWTSCTAFVEAVANGTVPVRSKWMWQLAGCLALLLTGLFLLLPPLFRNGDERRQSGGPTSPEVARVMTTSRSSPSFRSSPTKSKAVPVPIGIVEAPKFEPIGLPKAHFVFDGSGRIITPVDRFAPVTLETWCEAGRPRGGRNEKTIVTVHPTGTSRGMSWPVR